MTRAALVAPFGVESAAGYTANVHRSRKPTGDERANPEDQDQNNRVQQKILQSLRLSAKVFDPTLSRSLSISSAPAVFMISRARAA